MSNKNFKKTVTTMLGRELDMDAMRAANEKSIAIGNARMNARGDVIGMGGRIEISREQIVQDYYRNNPEGVKHVSIKAALPDTFESPADAISRLERERLVQGREDNDLELPDNVMGKKKARRLVSKGE